MVRQGSPTYIRTMVSRRALLRFMAAAAGAAPFIRPGFAAPGGESPWNEATHSAVRLIGGGADESGAFLTAGIEFRLATGFKTYWRDPGESGVPPAFDWAGSDNLSRVEVLWPAPHRFGDGSGFSIGYRDPLILPLRITPIDAGKPALLRMKIDYAVCDTMCIPAHGVTELLLSAKSAAPHRVRLAEELKKVPPRLPAGTPSPAGLAILGFALLDGKKPKLAVEAEAPADTPGLDLFIEGPKDSFFGAPILAAAKSDGPPTQRRFLVPIEERAKGLTRWPLLATLVAGERGVEVAGDIGAPTER